jgi:hypothetical protein
VVEREERERGIGLNDFQWFFLDLVPFSTADGDSKLKRGHIGTREKKTQVVPYLLRTSIILSASPKKIGITLNVPKPQYTAFFENCRGKPRFYLFGVYPSSSSSSSLLQCTTLAPTPIINLVFYFIGLAYQDKDIVFRFIIRV